MTNLKDGQVFFPRYHKHTTLPKTPEDAGIEINVKLTFEEFSVLREAMEESGFSNASEEDVVRLYVTKFLSSYSYNKTNNVTDIIQLHLKPDVKVALSQVKPGFYISEKIETLLKFLADEYKMYNTVTKDTYFNLDKIMSVYHNLLQLSPGELNALHDNIELLNLENLNLIKENRDLVKQFLGYLKTNDISQLDSFTDALMLHQGGTVEETSFDYKEENLSNDFEDGDELFTEPETDEADVLISSGLFDLLTYFSERAGLTVEEYIEDVLKQVIKTEIDLLGLNNP